MPDINVISCYPMSLQIQASAVEVALLSAIMPLTFWGEPTLSLVNLLTITFECCILLRIYLTGSL
jgi:hypothetical protein